VTQYNLKFVYFSLKVVALVKFWLSKTQEDNNILFWRNL